VPAEAVVHQIGEILELLRLLHRRGICHGDITPRNVYLRDGELVLGDLGIAKQALVDGPLYLGASTPAVFAPPDSDGSSWTPCDDVYQLALIALSALAGEVVLATLSGERQSGRLGPWTESGTITVRDFRAAPLRPLQHR